MGILNRTPDSFYDRGATFGLDALLSRAEQLVAEGADILDVGGVKAGPGPEVTEPEELDRVLPAVEALVHRFDVPVSVDTWRASVARAAYAAGAVMGNDISGFADPDYLTEAAGGRGGRGGHPHPAGPPGARPRAASTPTWWPTSPPSWPNGPGGPWTPAFPPTGSCSTPGSIWARRPSSRSTLLRASDRLAALGYPLLLSASNKTFLGALLDLDIDRAADGVPRCGGPRGHPRLPPAAGPRRRRHPAGP